MVLHFSHYARCTSDQESKLGIVPIVEYANPIYTFGDWRKG